MTTNATHTTDHNPDIMPPIPKIQSIFGTLHLKAWPSQNPQKTPDVPCELTKSEQEACDMATD